MTARYFDLYLLNDLAVDRYPGAWNDEDGKAAQHCVLDT